MVHALQEIWRVLIPGGRLVDFRPLGRNWPLEIITGEQVRLVGLADRKPGIRDDASCEQALAQVLSAGLFVRQWQEVFEFSSDWGTLAEADGPFVLPEAVAAEAQRLLVEMAEGTRVRIRFDNVIARYRKASPAEPGRPAFRAGPSGGDRLTL
jgi:hypothetical protein